MFLEKDDIVINVNHICSIKKVEKKICILLVCGETVTYDFETKTETSKAFDVIKKVITGNLAEKEKSSSLPQEAIDWLWRDDDDDDD